MQVKYNTSIMHLEELPLDIGYMSEKIIVRSKEDGKEVTMGGQNGKTQILISIPFIDEEIKKELQEIDKDLPAGGEYEVNASLILSKDLEDDLGLEKIKLYIDDKEEFADFYGTKLSGEPFDGGLTKALILISKDGAIFYDDFVNDLSKKFNKDTLARKVFAAQTCYTGKGCH